MLDREPVISTSLPFPCRRGKVRDVYDLGSNILIVSTDRISAFDWVLPCGIPQKGIVLTQLSKFWFENLQVAHHMLSVEVPEVASLTEEQRADLNGRTMLAKKAKVIPFECVVRGYLEGSGWREYQQSGKVCGIQLPPGLKQCDRLPEPIFTPATKAEEGHDENISFEVMVNSLGLELATRLRDLSLDIYRQGSQKANGNGIIIADTKFEWGWSDGELILVDEVLTPDSSRFWCVSDYKPGSAQPSFDKQFVREWLMESNWDRKSEPPALPEKVVNQTRQKYVEAFERLTGRDFQQWLYGLDQAFGTPI